MWLAAIRLLSLCMSSWTIMSWAYFSLDFWTGALLKRESYMLYKDPRAGYGHIGLKSAEKYNLEEAHCVSQRLNSTFKKICGVKEKYFKKRSF